MIEVSRRSCFTIVLVFVVSLTALAARMFVVCPTAFGQDLDRPETLKQAMPSTLPSRSHSFDELIREYSRLKSQKAPNTHLGHVIRYASSFKDSRVIPWLKSILENEKDKHLRKTAVSTIGLARTTEAAEALLEIYDKAKAHFLREAAISALGDTHTKKAAEGLLAIYKKEKAGALWYVAICALGDTQTNEAAEALLGIYEKAEKKQYDLREATISSLGSTRTREAAAALVEIFENVKKNPFLRYVPIYALGATRTKEAAEALAEIYEDAKDNDLMRYAAVSALGHTRTKEAADVLQGIYKKVKAGMRTGLRYYLLPALADVAEFLPFDLLVKLLKEVKAARDGFKVGHAIAKVGDEEAIVALTNKRGLPEPAVMALLMGIAERNRRFAEFEQRRKELGEGLPKPPEPVLIGKLAGLLDARSCTVRGATAGLMAASGDRSAIPALTKHLSEKDQDVRIEIILALGKLKAQEAVQTLINMLKRSKWEVTAAIIHTLGKIGDPASIEPLKKYLGHRLWHVRGFAIEALGSIRSKESVTVLIERMKKEEGRLLCEIGRKLEELTGLQLGTDMKAWTQWWEDAKDRYVLPEEDNSSSQVAKPGVAAGPKTRLGSGPKTEAVPTYYGIEVISHRVCFIIDVSGSMGEPISWEQPGNNIKIELAKTELINCIAALNPKARFNILCYADNVEAWAKRLAPASRQNKQRATEWIRSMTSDGSTNLGDAILSAFTDKTVDTIFVLSDGEPNYGKLDSPEEILDEVTRLNFARRIVIHTISFFPERYGNLTDFARPREFMRRLAEENGGQFVDY